VVSQCQEFLGGGAFDAFLEFVGGQAAEEAAVDLLPPLEALVDAA
jgi:hypothetical protein